MEHRPDLFVKYWCLFPDDDPFIFTEEHGIPAPELVQQQLDIPFEPPFHEDPAKGRTYTEDDYPDDVPF